jgi:uncharacterized membrane protein
VANALSGPQASDEVRRWGGVVMLGVLVQVAVGVVNILLSAPGWLQVVHLLLGTGLWIAVICFALTVLGPRVMMTAPLRGVVFDLDGTLYDKRPLEWFMVRDMPLSWLLRLLRYTRVRSGLAGVDLRQRTGDRPRDPRRAWP